MIELRNLCKVYRSDGIEKHVARNINFTFPEKESVALIGRNGAGKSTMLKMIAGTIPPTSGEIRSNGSISWPVGFAGSFHPDLTGAQNVKFIARIYAVDTVEMTDFCEEFAQLGGHFHLPVRTYSSGMRSRLAFATSMAIKFDTYLIDEVTAVGDAAFKKKSSTILKDRLRFSGAIVVSHSPSLLKSICTSGVVLDNGNMYYYHDVKRALVHHKHLSEGQLPPWMKQ